MFKEEDYVLNDSEYEQNSISPLENFISPSLDMINMNELMPMMTSGLDSNLHILTNQLDESTMDVAKKFEIVEFPKSPRGPPERRVFEGKLNFHVEINSSDIHKKKYLYSAQLNRIYVDMKMNFPVSFRWSGGQTQLYVRATPVFADESQAEKRVERCTQHTHETANNDISPTIVRNVLHSSREIGTRGVYYCGQVDLADSWYSVLVELPPASSATHAYQFVCKNSCSSGINRRAIEIIFTLEDAAGAVYGRQCVGVRVCACPRRDMQRDQLAAPAHKRAAPPAAPHGKKIKLEVVGGDDATVTLPPLSIVGVRAAVTGLEVMLSMTEQAASLRKNDAQAVEKYTKSITSLRNAIDEFKKL